jgi:predicted transcriptional regulator
MRALNSAAFALSLSRKGRGKKASKRRATSCYRKPTPVCYIKGMTAKTLKEALHRVEAWPEHAQDMLAKLALEIDHELREGKYHATPAELAGIDRGLKAAREGRFAADDQVEAVITKHRPA